MKVVSLSSPVDLLTGAKAVNAVVIDQTDDRIETHTLAFSADHIRSAEVEAAVASFTAGTITNEELAKRLFRAGNLAADVEERFVRVPGALGDRLTVRNGAVFVDLEPINDVLEAHILTLLEEDGTPQDAANWSAFSAFLGNLYANTDTEVRDQLFTWLRAENAAGHGLTFTDDGCFIGYKGCGGTLEAPLSGWSGWAYVDGVKVSGKIPNTPGTTLELPRHSVIRDPDEACAFGLHVGTYNFAKGYASSVLLTVKVNPRDVVSVPRDHRGAKIRVCRYEVLEAVTAPLNAHSFASQPTSPAPVGEALDESLVRSAIAAQKLLTFTYVTDRGVKSERTVRPTDAAFGPRGYITGYDLVRQKYRTFTAARITGLAVKGSTPTVPAAFTTVLAQPAPAQHSSVEGLLEQAVLSGAAVRFTYTAKDGAVSSRHIKPAKVAFGLLEGVDLAAEALRSFKLEGITDLTVDAKAAGAPVASDTPLAVAQEALAQGKTLRFNYLAVDGTSSVREVKVEDVAAGILTGRDISRNAPRSFKLDAITNPTLGS